MIELKNMMYHTEGLTVIKIISYTHILSIENMEENVSLELV